MARENHFDQSSFIQDGILDLYHYAKVTVPLQLSLLLEEALRQDVKFAFFTGYPITDEFIPALSRLRSLRVLGLMKTQVVGNALEAVSSLNSLEILDLTESPCGGQKLSSLKNSRLRVLRLSYTQVRPSELQALAGLPLEELEISGLGLRSSDLEFIRSLPALRTLTINQNPIDNTALDLLRALPKLEHVYACQTLIKLNGSPAHQSSRPLFIMG